MNNISITRPVNQPLLDYRGSDAEWEVLQRAIKGMPSGMDVPLIINGRDVLSDQKIESINPSTGELFCTGQSATAKQAEQAIEAALGAKDSWASLPLADRLQKFRDLEWILYQRRHEMTAVALMECGYSAMEVSGSWAEMMDFIRFNPYYLLELSRMTLGDGPMETNTLSLRALKGFTLAITPFNFPIAIGYNLPTAMALCGNTVVWKPSSDTPMTSWMLMKAIEDAGFPPGVINMITGPGSKILSPVLSHPQLTAVNFTGGVDTAKAIGHELYNRETPRHHFPRFVAETGGKGFMLVDAKADLHDAAACIVSGAFGRSGQKCSANSLILPDKRIWPDLEAALVEQMRSFNTASPLERDCDTGPVINRSAFANITGFIDRGKENPDVRLVSGGGYSDQKGFFIQPTIFEVNTDHHELLRVEIFGPVTAVRPVDGPEHAIKILNSHDYRLTGAVWSSNEEFLARWVPLLGEYAGNLYVNRKTTTATVDQQPFGGDGASGTNCKAGGPTYLLQFLSQGTVTRRHSRVLKDPSTWGWNTNR